MVAFTGSVSTGKRIAQLAAERIAKLNLELGGNDPFIVCDDVDLDVAVPAAAWAAFLNMGQVCTSAERFYVFDGIYDKFVERLAELTGKLRIGDPMGPDVDLGPMASDVQRAKADRERERNQAEAYRNDIVPRARGEAQRLIQEADAYRQQVLAQAQGEAQRFVSVYNAYTLAEDVTKQRLYLETMEQILRGTNKIVIDQGAASSGVIPYLPLPELQRRPPAGPTPPASGTVTRP